MRFWIELLTHIEPELRPKLTGPMDKEAAITLSLAIPGSAICFHRDNLATARETKQNYPDLTVLVLAPTNLTGQVEELRTSGPNLRPLTDLL